MGFDCPVRLAACPDLSWTQHVEGTGTLERGPEISSYLAVRRKQFRVHVYYRIPAFSISMWVCLWAQVYTAPVWKYRIERGVCGVSQIYPGVTVCFWIDVLFWKRKDEWLTGEAATLNFVSRQTLSGKRALLWNSKGIWELTQKRPRYWKWQINKRNFGPGLTELENVYVAIHYEGAKDRKNPLAYEVE